MKTGIQKTAAVFFLVVLASLALPVTVYMCLSPGTKKDEYIRPYRGLSNYSHEMNVGSKNAALVEYDVKLCGGKD
jgi:hypothetical protein